MERQQYAPAIEACFACSLACERCMAACLRETTVQDMSRCIALDIDCAEACRATAGFLARDSELASYMCKMCEEICEACGDECGKHAASHCQDCASACRRCAEECRRLAVKIPGAGAAQARRDAAH